MFPTPHSFYLLVVVFMLHSPTFTRCALFALCFCYSASKRRSFSEFQMKSWAADCIKSNSSHYNKSTRSNKKKSSSKTTIQKSSRYYNKKSVKKKSEIKCLKAHNRSSSWNMTWSRLVHTTSEINWICWQMSNTKITLKGEQQQQQQKTDRHTQQTQQQKPKARRPV